MSTRAGSTKKPSAFNEANETLYDPYPEFPVSEFYIAVPWPEWSDADLNSEVWEDTKARPTSTGSKTSFLTATAYEDPNPPRLPVDIREYVGSWKRPQEIFSGSHLNVYNPANEQFQLAVPSPVAECAFFKTFNELLPLLCCYASSDGFSVEAESPGFVPTTQGEPWRPWHHIYGMSKAGKGQLHKPVYCPYGKYVLRLFYFGCWRKFLIDDRIPCDKYGLCMLPITQCRGELWPILLAKGLLKIVSLTDSIIDFSMISCLTAWISMNFTSRNKSMNQIWRRFQVLLPRFELPLDEPEVKHFPMKDLTVGQSATGGKTFERFCVLMASLGGFAPEVNLNGLNVIVTMNRDFPLVKANKREGTKAWKRLRWVYWASEKGIWTDELLLPPYRRLQFISFARQLTQLLSPDPLQEATLYDLPEEDLVSQSTQHVGSGDDVPYEPKQWSDFYKFCEYLMGVHVLLKPSSFLFNFKITSLRDGSAIRDMTTPATAKTAIKSEPRNEFIYNPDLTPTLNQPIFLYCESSFGISIFFTLWVCPGKEKVLTGYLDSQQPEILKVGHGTLIVERFDWRTLQQGEVVGFLKTVGNSSMWVNLRPGRHVLKLWLSCDSPFTINVFSNTELCVHKGTKIRFQMVNESGRVINYIGNVSDAFIALSLKFGKSDLPSALKDFYKIIKPGNDSSPEYHKKLDKFIETFLNCIMLALKSLVPNVDELKIMLGALRSLFFNPNIQCDLPGGPPASLYGAGAKKAIKKVAVIVKERTLAEILCYPWTPEEIKQIVTIQRIFRGYRARLLLKYQSPARKEFKPFTDRLKKVCDTIFVPAKRDVEVGKIIRMIVTSEPDLLPTFKFYLDFPNVIDVDEYTGKVAGVEPFAWIPLARFIVTHHSPDPAPCSFYFSCNLEQFVVSGVNNDTNEEIFSLANTISPGYYLANTKGYTIFIFGWNESSTKTVNWRLEMVKMKHFQSVHLCNMLTNVGCHPYAMPTLEVNSIKNFYVPNQKSKMCRCVIKIQKRSLLTLRLSASYSEAQFVLTISLDKRHCLPGSEDSACKNLILTKRYSTNGAVILPSLVLEPFQRYDWGEETDDESTWYVLEAHISNDSWPLTKQEWGVIEPIRVNGEVWKDLTSSMSLKKAGSESRKKLTRMSKRSLQERNVENPLWLLQVLTDSSEGDPSEVMVVEEDRSYQESVKAMKALWEEKNPGRRKKGRDLRLKFLQAAYLENRLKQLERNGGEVEGEGDRFDEAEDFKELLHKMTSFSYLTCDKSTERLLQSPRVLPWVPTEELLVKYRRAWTDAIDGSSTESFVTHGRSKNVSDSEEEERKEFLATCNHYRLVMVNHLAEEQKQSNELIEQAYKKRLKAVQRMMG